MQSLVSARQSFLDRGSWQSEAGRDGGLRKRMLLLVRTFGREERYHPDIDHQ
jgi:hypothetical protein